MPDRFDVIKKDALARSVENAPEAREKLMVLDRRRFAAGATLDLLDRKLELEQPSHVVFVDPTPMMNYSHPCHYLVYNADNGGFIRRVEANFPHYLQEGPEHLERFYVGPSFRRFERVRRLRVPLEPAKLSAYRELSPLPVVFGRGRRFAIFYSGASNCRHVNDMEFLYRTLVDVYGFDPANVIVCNRDGTRSWAPAGSWEPAVTANYPVDGTPFRMPVNHTGNRAGFQAAIADVASRIAPGDSLFIHTNNHGGWDGGRNEAFMSGWGGSYYAGDFADDLATLPRFSTLLAVMEPCHAGGFNDPIMTHSPATRTVVQAAVPWDKSSAGGWFFDPWAEMWISAMAGVRGDGSALAVSPDDNLNSRISAWEAYDYAIGIDDPVMSESSVGVSQSVYLSASTLKPLKEIKELKEVKEVKEIEPKRVLDPKALREPKALQDPKRVMEPKEFDKPQDGIDDPRVEVARPELEERLRRVEDSLSRLEPFIGGARRPDLNPRGTGGGGSGG
ncbi:MAG TPA: hypothetical protein PKW35_18785 [Nannocystaceae bacterium]|nr:hypothetical protein [Nannocystaceae bacterium]